MGELTGSDRRHLRGLANPLKATVQVGDAGPTENVFAAAEARLRDHELVKVRIAGTDRRERREVAEKIAAATGSEIAGLVGRVVILYRAAADPDDRKIQLPSTRPE